MAAAQKSIRSPNPTLPDSVFKMFDMHGKVVIITGGSGGIGYEVGRALAEAGADIALWYNSSGQADDRAATIAKDFGVKCKAYKCSVQNFNEVCSDTIIIALLFGTLKLTMILYRLRLLPKLLLQTSGAWT